MINIREFVIGNNSPSFRTTEYERFKRLVKTLVSGSYSWTRRIDCCCALETFLLT